MLELPSVTLCCIDTVNPALALRALRLSSAGIRFARVLLLSDSIPEAPGVEVRAIERLASRAEYSAFVLKSLLRHIDTPFVLLIQWDGYVIDPDGWREAFLACDYIGAKWFWHEDDMRVGNGGFSLRSRKLLVALQDPRVVLNGNEDETIGRSYRRLLEREHGIVFASEALADAFAFEAAYPVGKTFGFHGLYNFCRVVPPAELAELARTFTPAIARSPQLLQLGRNCLALGQWQTAAAIFGRIVDETPDHAEARAALATASSGAAAAPRAGRNDPCPCGSGKRYKHCHGAAAVATDAAPPPPGVAQQLRHAMSLHQRNDTEAALRIYRQILAQEPDNAVALSFLGVIHYQRGEFAEALPLLERAVSLRVDEPEFHNNLGLALMSAGREADAIAEYRSALELKPGHTLAWSNLGLALQARNEVPAAIDAFRHALRLDPGLAQARWNLSLALLLAGEFDEGWREYDARLSLPELQGRRNQYPGPRWDGSAPRGKTLLLYPEQGIGDALQFARFVTPLAALGARCLIRCSDALAPLLASVPGVAQVVRETEPLPQYDAHAPLLSLPGLLGTGAAIPATVPYVSVPEAQRDAARAALARSSGSREVGLAWAGNPKHVNDRNRSIALELLAPLFGVAGVDWFSLQQGEGAAQLAGTPGANAVTPLAPDATLLDTAALVAELDLVISVDTSIAHLAGALAKPVWLLLPFSPDWRWRLERGDTPWYPTMRLFRQRAPRDWPPVVEQVAAALRIWVSSPG